MELGEIANVTLTSSTRTTELLRKIVQFGKGPKTLCIDMNMRVHYNRPRPLFNGEKMFRIYLYLSDWTIIENRENLVPLHMTFTDIKKGFTKRDDITVEKDYDIPLIDNINKAVRNNLDMEIDSEVDYFFEKPLCFDAQPHKGCWGNTYNEYFVGVKIKRCRW